MDQVDDKLDLRYHRGVKPDNYYRYPTLESLDGALKNEFEKGMQSLIPVEVVTEFVLGGQSLLTVQPSQQKKLELLGALCRDIEGKDRLKTQRAVARSIVETIQGADEFKYSERQAYSAGKQDGTRFTYVCVDSLQNRDRKNNQKKNDEEDHQDGLEESNPNRLPIYDCGGAIHIKFSLKREAINAVYKHTPIHSAASREPNGQTHDQDAIQLPALQVPPFVPVNQNVTAAGPVAVTAEDTRPPKRKRRKKSEIQESNGLHQPVSPVTTHAPSAKKLKKNSAPTSPQASRSSKNKQKSMQPQSPSKSRSSNKKNSVPEPAPALAKAAKPSKAPNTKSTDAQGKVTQKRSWTGCFPCKQRRRKCTEDRPACAYCLKIDDDCEYP